MTGAVRLSEDGEGVALLLLDRPDKLNALDPAMLAGLAETLASIEASETIRCVILAGAGAAFCAGGDIAAWSALSPRDFARRWVREGHTVLDAFARLRQPTIALLQGPALGGGLELAACADIRIAEAHVTVGQPETGLGIVAGWSGAQRAVRRFGPQAVRRMALFGEILDAEEASALGIVDHVAPTGAGEALARTLARTAAARAPIATEIVKMTIAAAEGEERARPLDALAGGYAMATRDLAEGLAARRDKRPPRFFGE